MFCLVLLGCNGGNNIRRRAIFLCVANICIVTNRYNSRGTCYSEFVQLFMQTYLYQWFVSAP